MLYFSSCKKEDILKGTDHSVANPSHLQIFAAPGQHTRVCMFMEII